MSTVLSRNYSEISQSISKIDRKHIARRKMANTPLFSIFKVIYCILFSLFLTVIMYSIFTVFITIHFFIVNSNQRSDNGIKTYFSFSKLIYGKNIPTFLNAYHLIK